MPRHEDKADSLLVLNDPEELDAVANLYIILRDKVRFRIICVNAY